MVEITSSLFLFFLCHSNGPSKKSCQGRPKREKIEVVRMEGSEHFFLDRTVLDLVYTLCQSCKRTVKRTLHESSLVKLNDSCTHGEENSLSCKKLNHWSSPKNGSWPPPLPPLRWGYLSINMESRCVKERLDILPSTRELTLNIFTRVNNQVPDIGRIFNNFTCFIYSFFVVPFFKIQYENTRRTVFFSSKKVSYPC